MTYDAIVVGVRREDPSAAVYSAVLVWYAS
jgi:hypothetical protein